MWSESPKWTRSPLIPSAQCYVGSPSLSVALDWGSLGGAEATHSHGVGLHCHNITSAFQPRTWRDLARPLMSPPFSPPCSLLSVFQISYTFTCFSCQLLRSVATSLVCCWEQMNWAFSYSAAILESRMSFWKPVHCYKAVVPNQGLFCPHPGDSLGWHNEGSAPDIWWVETGYAAKCLTMHRTGPYNNYLAQKVTNAKIEKPCCKLLGLFINTA